MRLNLAYLAGAAFLFSACAQKPLYHWEESYQKGVYGYLNDEFDPQKELESLTKYVQNADKKGEKVPPGLHAHMGLLHSQIGDLEGARREFAAEVQLYPEAKTYMDFLSAKDKSKFGQKGQK